MSPTPTKLIKVIQKIQIDNYRNKNVTLLETFNHKKDKIFGTNM